MLYATVRNRKIHVKKPDTVVRNGVNVDWLQLEMDDEWAEMDSIVCVFVARYNEEQTISEEVTKEDGTTETVEKKTLVEQEITKEMLHTFGQKLLVPWETLVHSGMLSVSCTGYVGSEKIMTTMYPDSFWQIVQNGPVSGDSTIDPTPSLYDQILAAAGTANDAALAANQAKDQLLQDKANGVFNGADGASAKVSVGSTQTGSEGSEAQVYSTGTDQDLKLHFVIPRGRQGMKGETGPQGPVGATGQKGDTGDTGPQGPKGDKGDKGDKGEQGTQGPVGPSGVYVGSGEMPDGYNVQIDPDGGASFRIDDTLTQPGQAADAKATGDELRSLSGKIEEIPSGKDGITPTIGENGNWYLGDTDTGKPSRGETGPAGADGYTPVKGTDYFTAADKQEIAEAAAGMVSIPDKLPNPNALTFTGAVTGSYDGSAPLSVNIPQGGGGGGSWHTIGTQKMDGVETAVSFDLAGETIIQIIVTAGWNTALTATKATVSLTLANGATVQFTPQTINATSFSPKNIFTIFGNSKNCRQMIFSKAEGAQYSSVQGSFGVAYGYDKYVERMVEDAIATGVTITFDKAPSNAAIVKVEGM